MNNIGRIVAKLTLSMLILITSNGRNFRDDREKQILESIILFEIICKLFKLNNYQLLENKINIVNCYKNNFKNNLGDDKFLHLSKYTKNYLKNTEPTESYILLLKDNVEILQENEMIDILNVIFYDIYQDDV